MGELDLAVTGGHGMEKLCVIKRVLAHLRVADNVQRFREEATVMMRLSHGNLVGVLDAGREEGQFYLAMDFVEGKDLLATWNQCATRRVAFPVEIAAYIVKELARGLAYAHAYRDLRLVHRDISPANVLLSCSGEVKLTDFGLAISKLKEQQTAPGIIYGKLAYLAPEQARGHALDGRVDIYAAGILLWEMLTGQQLFPAQRPGDPPPRSPEEGSTLDALERVRNPVVAAPSTVTARVPTALDAIVMRALQIDPDDRYQTGEELRADLAAFLAKFAPATDAATLASFMALLFQQEINQERVDRDALLAQASGLLSGPLGGLQGPAMFRETTELRMGEGGANDDPYNGLRLVDPALWNSSPRVANTISPPGGSVAEAVASAAAAAPMPDPGSGGQDESMVATGIQRRRQQGDRRGRPTRAAGRMAEGYVEVRPGDEPYRVYGTMAPDGAGSSFDGEGAGANVAPAARSKGEGRLDTSGEGDERVGTTIAGRYFLRRLCGEGAMGRVYEGHHVEIGRRVAIKILHSSFRNTADVVERFRREARAASKIGHPNIVDVTDSGTTPDGAFFFVMEYLDGVDLEQLIAREGPLSIERALLIAAQACRALAAAHAAGVIHRDLKPANVMLIRHRDEEDFVKVLDFGISKQSELDIDPRGKDVGLTRPDAAVGTPIYMAPEQVAGHPADARTDIYAIGELLFEMLTGKAPCSGSDIIAVFNKKANEDPAPVRSLRPEVPVRIEQLMTRAMSRLPADRHATMAELKDELMNALARLGEAPTPAGSPPSQPAAVAATGGRGWRAPPRALWLTAAGVVAGLGLASTAVLWRTDVNTVPARAARTSPQASSPAPSNRVDSPGPGATSRLAETAPAGQAPSTAVPIPVLALLEPAVPAGATEGKAPATADPTHRTQPPRATSATAPMAPVHSRAPRGGAGAGSRGAGQPAAPPRPAAALAPSAADDLLRGRAAFAKGNFPQALRLGRTAMTAGDAVGGHLLIADAYYKLERFAEALAEYDAALKVAPTNPQARRGRELAQRHANP